MSFLIEYALFLAKTATIVIAIVIILVAIIALKAKSKASEEGSLHIKKRNEKYDELSDTINDVIQTKSEKKEQKAQLKKEKKSKSKSQEHPKKIFVIRFEGDMRASGVDDLRETITAILLIAKPQDHVLLCLDSPGGLVNAYGLAASQLQRLRNANIYLIAAIDKVAASGGYMMACVANEIIAAPFSIIGSIGVVAQLPNFHRFLEKNNIDFEQITAGEYKRTLTLFGKNTSTGREKFQEEVNEAHDLFKSFVKTNREFVNIDDVATGEHWFATQCIEKKLVDKIQTSDDYLLSKKDSHDIYELEFKMKQPFLKRFMTMAHNTFHQIMSAR